MAGSVDTTTTGTGLTIIGRNGKRATFTFLCTGDAADGSIPNTDIPSSDMRDIIDGEYTLVGVDAFPTYGGTAPDAASIFILMDLDADGDTVIDLLGSEDDNSTAYAGKNMIHATLPRRCMPSIFSPRAGLHVNYFPQITGQLALKAIDQDTASANWTVVLTFER